MLGQSADQMSSVKALGDNIVEQHHHVRHFVGQRQIDDIEIVLTVEHVQVFNHLLIGDITLAERNGLIEDRQGIAHSAISLLGNDIQRLLLVGDMLFLCHGLEMTDDIGHRHPLEVVYLTTTDDRRQDLMFLGGGEDEDHVGRWLFQRLEESIESLCGEHVHLVDDKHFVFADLRRYTCLLHQRLDVLHGVVTGRV